jgi:hypothetical protein
MAVHIFSLADGRSMIEIQPWMLIPGALMVGLFPYMLLQLKMLVTSAMTFSNMVLWGAVFMTLRNVFGNRPNGIIVYDNLGYRTEPPLPHNPGVRHPSPHGPASEVATRLPYAAWTPKVPRYTRSGGASSPHSDVDVRSPLDI